MISIAFLVLSTFLGNYAEQELKKTEGGVD